MKKYVLAISGAAAALACSSAMAWVNVGINFGFPAIIAPEPVYVAPAPVYAAPVYAAPRVAYPYYYPTYYYGPHYRGRYHHDDDDRGRGRWHH